MRLFIRLCVCFIILIPVTPSARVSASAAVESSTSSARTTYLPVFDTSGNAGSGPQRAPFPFDAIQLTWQTDGDPTGVVVSFATASGGRWSAWTTAAHVDEFLLPDAPAGTQTSTLFPLPARAEEWQIRLIQSTKSPGTVTSVSITTVQTGATIDATSLVTAAVPLTAGAKPPIVARTTWGDATVKQWDANGSAGKTTLATWMPTDAEIAKPTHVIIHHTATPNAEGDWAARVRQIWGYHTLPTGNDWGDIGYHYLIDPNGVIYEGRYQGVRSDGTVIDGAHDYGFNRGTIGISMIGTYDEVDPTDAAQTALNNLIGYLATTYRITPDTTAWYAHQRVTLNTIIGHRDAQVAGHSTGCPGNRLHDLLPAIRRRAAANVGTAPVQQWITGVTVADADVFVGDAVTFRITVRNPYPDRSISSAAMTFLTPDTNYVYLSNECWAKTDASGKPLFPKAAIPTDRYQRLRVMAGISGWDSAHANTATRCPTASTEDHPWRWSIGTTPLAPGSTRVVSGSVRFATAGTYTVRFGVMKDWIGYPDYPCAMAPGAAACGLFPQTVVVRQRMSPTATTMPALATQLAASTRTSAAATATRQATGLAGTATAIADDFTATARAASGSATVTPSPTPTLTATASTIPLYQTVTHWAGQTATALAAPTGIAPSETPTTSPTRTRTPTVQPLLVPRTAMSIPAVANALTVVGAQLVTLAPNSNAIDLWDATTLVRGQRVLFRGTAATHIGTVPSSTDTFFVAGNYTAQYIAVQRFRIVAGKARETGYWIAPFTGGITSMLALPDSITVAAAAHGTKSTLFRVQNGALLAETQRRVALPGPGSALIDANGAGTVLAVYGNKGTQGYVLSADYRTPTPTLTTPALTTYPLAAGCVRWIFPAAQPVAQLWSADNTTLRTHSYTFGTAALRGATNTGVSTNTLIACTRAAPAAVVVLTRSTGVVQVSVLQGTRANLRATATLPLTSGKSILAVALTATAVWWSDGVTVRRVQIRPLDYY